MIKNSLMDFVDIELKSMEYSADKTNFNSLNKIVDLVAMNKDTDPTNDVITSNIFNLDLSNDLTGSKNYELIVDTMKFYSD